MTVISNFILNKFLKSMKGTGATKVDEVIELNNFLLRLQTKETQLSKVS